MNILRRGLHSRIIGAIVLALVLFIMGVGSPAVGQQKKPPLPTVLSANVPFYPRTPQEAHIQGVVQLRISTDGSRASSIEVESGPAMLAQAAKENVKTWQFEPHSPTTFEATFHYKLLPSSKCDSECNCDSVGSGTMLLQLPTDVEVSAQNLPNCFDAGRKGPAVVTLTVKHDGQVRPVPDHVTLSFDKLSMQVPVRDGKFEVPPEFASAKKITFAADIEGDHILVSDLYREKFVQADWTILLAERDYGEDYQSEVSKGADVRSSCIIVFEPYGGEDTLVFVTHCRSKHK